MADTPNALEYVLFGIGSLLAGSGGWMMRRAKQEKRAVDPSLERRVSALEVDVEALTHIQRRAADEQQELMSDLRFTKNAIIELRLESRDDHRRVREQLDRQADLLRELQQAVRRAD